MTDSGYDEEQLAHRAKHGFLVWDAIRCGTRTIETRMRDGWITRLFNSMPETHQDAMIEIETAFRAITAGLGMKNFDPDRLPGARHLPDSARDAERVSDYFTWGRTVQKRRLSHAMAMAIIAEGKTCNQVDRDYRQRKGTAMWNLRECLDVYCELHGFPRR